MNTCCERFQEGNYCAQCGWSRDKHPKAPMTPPPPLPVPCERRMSYMGPRVCERCGFDVDEHQLAATVRSEQAQELEMWKELATRHEAHIRTLQASLHEQGNRLGDRAQALETMREKVKELEARVDSETPIRCLFCKRVPPPPAVCNDEVTQSICFECLERVAGQLRTSKAAQDMSVTGAAKQWSFVASSVEPDAIRTWQELLFPVVSGSATSPSVTSGGAVETTEAQGGQPAPERCSTCGFSSALHAEAAQEIERLKAEKDRPQPIATAESDRLSPIRLTEDQTAAAKQWAADDRLWTTQETVEFNLQVFARKILSLAALGARHEPLTALKEYVRHINGCQYSSYPLRWQEETCTCGLAALLAALPSGVPNAPSQTEKKP